MKIKTVITPIGKLEYLEKRNWKFIINLFYNLRRKNEI
jgi:hypothetical protein